MTTSEKKRKRSEWKKTLSVKVAAIRRTWGHDEKIRRAKLGELRREHLERLLFPDAR